MEKLKLIQLPSANFDARPNNNAPEMIILHYTGMKKSSEAIELLCNPESLVSAHYVIDESGTCFQLVDESHRAWHAGISYWAGNDNINNCSIGIELSNPGHEHGYKAFPEPQMLALLDLTKEIITRNSIKSQFILGHSDIAPDRKLDPGELFNWQRLAVHGIGLWPTTDLTTQTISPEVSLKVDKFSIKRIQKKMAGLGYKINISGQYDRQTMMVAKAFQRHFRPANVTGMLDTECESILDNLLLQVD